MSQLSSRLQAAFRWILGPASNAAESSIGSRTSHVRHGRMPLSLNQHRHHARYQRSRTTGLDIARFGLFSIATLPFSLWISLYAWNYVNRVHLCQVALAEEDNEISFILSKSKTSKEGKCIGRDRPLAEVRSLLSNPPHEIIVVAGTNESGKSRFVAELLKGLPLSRGVTYIQLAHLVDSLSTFAHAFVRSFDLRWLNMRHALVDVLPFAGSEIVVMKERFSSRDLSQSLQVITEALKAKASDPNAALPVQWCIYITKERKLAHVVLTGNEELVFTLMNQNRTTRGHVKVIGLADLNKKDTRQLILQEFPDATPEEILKIRGLFGGFIHDLQSVSREIQAQLSSERKNESLSRKDTRKARNRDRIIEDVLSARFNLQLERVTAAFAKGKDEDEVSRDARSERDHGGEDEDMDPFLDPLKAAYSEAQASQIEASDTEVGEEVAGWSQLQLWQTIQRLVETKHMTVPFADLRDDIFDGKTEPLLQLMNEDVLGFEVESSSESGAWSWEVKPATPALARAFQHLIDNSNLKERFQEMEEAEHRRRKIHEIECDRKHLRQERAFVERRKNSLLKMVEIGNKLELHDHPGVKQTYNDIFFSIVGEEADNEKQGAELRSELATLLKEGIEDTDPGADGLTDWEEEEEIRYKNDHKSIKRLLKAAVLRASYKEGNNEQKFVKIRDAIEKVSSSNGAGISAADVVRLIKDTSGEEVDLEAAKAFVEAWDDNKDTRIGYDEFVRMLLSDEGTDDKSRRKHP